MRTPATLFLDSAGVEYSLHEYKHDAAVTSFGLEAAAALGVDPAVVFKTLVAHLDDTGPGNAMVVAIVAVTDLLDLKALARAAGAKRAAMADVAAAERITGYVAGGISPFGQKRLLPTFIDETAEICDRIYVSGGQRGFDIGIDPRDLATLLDATSAPIART